MTDPRLPNVPRYHLVGTLAHAVRYAGRGLNLCLREWTHEDRQVPLQVYKLMTPAEVWELAPSTGHSERTWSWETDSPESARAAVAYGVGEVWKDPNADPSEPYESRSEVTGAWASSELNDRIWTNGEPVAAGDFVMVRRQVADAFTAGADISILAKTSVGRVIVTLRAD